MREYKYYNEDGSLNAYNVKAACREIMQSNDPETYWPNDLMQILTSDKDHILERMGVPIQKAAWIAARSRSAETENFELAKPERKREILEAMARNLKEAMAIEGVLSLEEIDRNREWSVSSRTGETKTRTGEIKAEPSPYLHALEEAAKAFEILAPEERKYRKTVFDFISLYGKAFKLGNLNKYILPDNNLKELADPDFLKFIGFPKIKIGPSDIDGMGPDRKLAASKFFKERLCETPFVQDRMLDVLRIPRSDISTSSEPEAVLGEITLERMQAFCRTQLHNYRWRSPEHLLINGNSEQEKFVEKWGKALSDGVLRDFSKIFFGKDIYRKFNSAYKKDSTLENVTNLYDKLSKDIGRKKTRPIIRKAPEGSKILYEIKPGNKVPYGLLDNIKDSIVMQGKDRDSYINGETGTNPPVYSPALLRSVFNEDMLAKLGADISFERQLSYEELSRVFRIQANKGEFPWKLIAATWANRIEEGFSDEQLMNEQRKGPKFSNLRQVMEDHMIPLIDSQIKKENFNVLSLMEGSAPEKPKAITWEAGQKADREATQSYIAARQLPGRAENFSRYGRK